MFAFCMREYSGYPFCFYFPRKKIFTSKFLNLKIQKDMIIVKIHSATLSVLAMLLAWL